MISCPYTNQQNDIFERKHIHLVETALTLMSEANLSPSFWFHSCAYATFLINRMLCKVLEMKSPYQVLFGKAPEIQKLKVFGSAVYPFLRPYNSNKLQARSVQCVFLGYVMGCIGVTCYNIVTRKLILSRHVIHDESMFPYKIQSTASANGTHHVQPIMQKPIVIQMLPSVPYITQRENHNSHQDNMSVSIFERSATTSSRALISSLDLGSSSSSLSQGPSSQLEYSSFTPTQSGMS